MTHEQSDSASLHAAMRRGLDAGDYAAVINIFEKSQGDASDARLSWLYGLALAHAGSLDQAAAVLKAATSAMPEAFNIRADYCRIQLARKEFSDVENELRVFESMVSVDPIIEVIVGELKLGLGRLAEALEILEAAYADGERALIALIALAEARFKKVQYAAALSCAKEAQRLYGGNVTVLRYMLPAAMGAHDDSSRQKCFAIADAFPPPVRNELHDQWARILFEANHYSYALDVMQRYFEDAPFDKSRSLLRIRALLNSQKVEDAVSGIEALLSQQPDDPETLAQLSHSQRISGNAEAATETALRALDLDFTQVTAHQTLIEIDGAGHANRVISDLSRFVSEEPAERERLVEAQFTLGRAFELTGDARAAFDAFSSAQSQLKLIQKDAGKPYDAKVLEGLVKWIEEEFTADFQQKNAVNLEADGPQFIFIVGMPRSGTTLMEQIISSANGVFAAGERMVFNDVFAEYELMRRGQRRTALSIVENTKDRWRRHQMDALPEAAREANYVTEKLPFNFWYVGLISLLFPRSKFIHMKRDPRDVSISIFRRHFNDSIRFAHSLDDIAHYYSLYERLMKHWKSQNVHSILDVRYADVVKDFDRTAKSVYAFCGLEWSDQARSFYKKERPIYTHSSSQARRPLYDSGVGSWRQYEPYLDGLIEALKRYGVDFD